MPGQLAIATVIAVTLPTLKTLASTLHPGLVLKGGYAHRGLVDLESSSEEDEDEDSALDADAEEEAELAAAWGVGALAANPEEDVPLVSEDTSR